MCAALNAAGYADAVLSFDNDTLLFGAARVYTSMQLLVNNPRGCGVACCEAADVARLLGLRGGGWHALRVGAVLMGGDYEMQGAAAVGGELTLQLLQRLCAGKEVCEGGGGGVCVGVLYRCKFCTHNFCILFFVLTACCFKWPVVLTACCFDCLSYHTHSHTHQTHTHTHTHTLIKHTHTHSHTHQTHTHTWIPVHTTG